MREKRTKGHPIGEQFSRSSLGYKIIGPAKSSLTLSFLLRSERRVLRSDECAHVVRLERSNVAVIDKGGGNGVLQLSRKIVSCSFTELVIGYFWEQSRGKLLNFCWIVTITLNLALNC